MILALSSNIIFRLSSYQTISSVDMEDDFYQFNTITMNDEEPGRYNSFQSHETSHCLIENIFFPLTTPRSTLTLLSFFILLILELFREMPFIHILVLAVYWQMMIILGKAVPN